jgi:acetyltransferase-like isoleucine patch superfamily enzyme
MIHPTATIDNGAKIGEKTNVWHYSHVRENSHIGNNCNVGQNCYVDFDVKIGNGVKIQNNVSVWHGVTIEDDVFVGPCVTFTNDLYPRAFIWSDNRVETTLVKKGASIGANSTIVCGNRVIGEYSMIAAGSVVTKDVPMHGLVRGNPARLVGFVCKCGRKLKKISDNPEDHEQVIMECTDENCKFNEKYHINKNDYSKIQ